MLKEETDMLAKHGRYPAELQNVRAILASDDMDLLVRVCQLFLGATLSEATLATHLKRRAELTEFVSLEDLTFIVLVAENNWDRWAAKAQRLTLRSPEPEYSIPTAYGILGGPNAQQRFAEIRDRLSVLLNTLAKKEEFSRRFYHHRVTQIQQNDEPGQDSLGLLVDPIETDAQLLVGAH